MRYPHLHHLRHEELTFNLSSAKLSIKEPFSKGTHFLQFNQAELRTDPILINFLRHKDTNED